MIDLRLLIVPVILEIFQLQIRLLLDLHLSLYNGENVQFRLCKRTPNP